jgi:aminoglycoside 3-N-acetyltransferase
MGVSVGGEHDALVTEGLITEGLQALGLTEASLVIVHASLGSFGTVQGGAATVCRALVACCGTVLVPAGTDDLTRVPAPPGLLRPHNAIRTAATWDEFNQAVARAVPYADDLPIDRELGRIPEAVRRLLPHRRSTHPLMSYVAVGRHAEELVQAQRLDWPLGPLEALAGLGGDVVLLGVSHTVNTMIHLAEQRLGRSCFYRYAKLAQNVWGELPNIPGQSHGFDGLEPALIKATQEVRIGACRARRIAAADVLVAAERRILADPAALLCNDPECRCFAALQQRLAVVASQS